MSIYLGGAEMSQPRRKRSKSKYPKQREPANKPPKIKYEDTEKFAAFDRMMRSNRGVWI